jgi:pSer/pThr/pTyr-binding forkhead associated (FHA) protein
MPGEIGGQRVSRIILDSLEVSRYHVSITWEGGNYVANDHNSRNGIYVNGRLCKSSVLSEGDVLQVGPFTIQLRFVASGTTLPLPRRSEIRFHPQTQMLEPQRSPAQGTGQFPPPVFSQQQVDPQDLHATGLPVEEGDYLSVGEG